MSRPLFLIARGSLSRGFRSLHNSPPRRKFISFGLAGCTLLGSVAFLPKILDRDLSEQPPVEQHEPRVSSLLRSWLVYSIISVPLLVDKSDDILSVLTSIPGLKQATEAVVKLTFFTQVSFFYISLLELLVSHRNILFYSLSAEIPFKIPCRFCMTFEQPRKQQSSPTVAPKLTT
jgi:hypothetical protein